jgi:3-hydroxyisobutyrate dehydrogenase
VADRVGFIGLGLMGKPMAKRLLAAGYNLTVHNRSRGPVEELASMGAFPARSPKEVAERSDVVLLMLPDSSDVEQVVLGKEGLIEGLRSGSVVVDCSTVSPDTEVRMAARLKEIGVDYLDAPVTGSTPAAESGTLTFMVGGEREAFERVLPVLRHLGTRIEHMGPVGCGQLTKLCNQIAVAGNLLAAAEAILFAKRVGLDPKRVIEVIGAGAASSWQLVNLGPKMVERDFRPGFKAAHLKKDLRIVMEVSERNSLPLPLASLAWQIVRSLVASGYGEQGTQAIIEVLERLASGQTGET